MILVMLAASSLSLPALAQQNTPASSPSQPSAASSQMQGNEMSPEKMKPAQIRELRQSLNDKGFRVGDVDGEWGPHTADALKKFQESNKMPSSGQLNANTITALGLKSSDFGLSEQLRKRLARHLPVATRSIKMKTRGPTPRRLTNFGIRELWPRQS
jgi:Putative peptidoglycan binding domain